MGQGYSMAALAAAAVNIDVPELADLVHDKTIASGRFMKSVRAKGQQGYVYVKVLQKPYASFDVRPYIKQITEERNALNEIPNALGYQRILEVGNSGFLVRQYMFSSLYDRLSTRPFLEEIERKWMAFQLLCAVRDCHARNIYHGDIKTENILVTSWNWLYLTDFSSCFKPNTLPEDNPADFFFYFDTSSRRICYVAPERFTSGSHDDHSADLNWAMDMFSIGCTLAELFLEGPIFTLSQIFKYRAGEYSPELTHMNKIDDQEVKKMILNMIELDPEKRYSAEQHLAFHRGKMFPEYFYDFLHQYMQDLTQPLAEHQPVSLDADLLNESDHRIEKVYQDFDKISYFVGPEVSSADISRIPSLRHTPEKPPSQRFVRKRHVDLNNGTLLFLALVSASLRSTSKASARLKACDLLVAFAKGLPDEVKLDRVIPYIVGLLGDRSDIVKIEALHAMTEILNSVVVVSPINAYLFPEYIFPRLKSFLTGGSSNQATPIVRAAYASCLASLALSSAKMLDVVQAVRADGRLPSVPEHRWMPDATYHGLYDVARTELLPYFEEATTTLITDSETSVRRALLGSVSRLCIFFGSSRSSEIILSHLNTYLNDRDWMLRCAFFEALVGVALYVGSSSLEEFVLPIMVGSLTDPENFVVERVFRSLSRMASFGLFQRSVTWELAAIATRFFIHPSTWIREAAVQFIFQLSQSLTEADKVCIVSPLLLPYLKTPVSNFTEEHLLDHLKAPLPKSVLEAAIQWAKRKSKSLFWTAASRDSAFVITEGESVPNPATMGPKIASRVPPSQRDKDDQISLETLRNLGMSQDDEFKLLALREYILKVASRKTDGASDEHRQHMNSIVSFSQIGVAPQNVFFDQHQPIREVKKVQNSSKNESMPGQHTLADALLDASTTINDITKRHSHTRQGNRDLASPRLPMPIDISRTQSEDHFQLSDSPGKSSPRTEALRGQKEEPTSTRNNSPMDANKAHKFQGQKLQHSKSALSLLSRADTTKAGAEISTIPETAFGKLQGQSVPKSYIDQSNIGAPDFHNQNRSKSPLSYVSSQSAYEANHSYTGKDPHVLKMLDNHFVENFAVDLLDFGQMHPAADTAAPIRRVDDTVATGTSTPSGETLFLNEPWRPSGQLLTQFSEHNAAINRVVPSPDHSFFVTASDDGTCKVWDTARLEKNVTPRSRYTHRHTAGSKVKSLCFVEGTHTFISGSDDGCINAVFVDFKNIEGGDGSRYGKPRLVRDFQLPGIQHDSTNSATETFGNIEHAIQMQHFRTPSSQSLLHVVTNRSRLLIIDLKNMDISSIMQNPVEHGTPTTFCIDRKCHWLLIGTTRGILDLWDLRFKLRLRSFGIGGANAGMRIDRLVLHPSKGHGRWVMVSCNGEISVWDIEKQVCREVLRPSTVEVTGLVGGGSSAKYEAWYPEERSSEKVLARFANDIKRDESLIKPNLLPTDDQSTHSIPEPAAKVAAGSSRSRSLTPAMYVLTDWLLNSSQPTNPNKACILFSGGSDRNIRYWNLAQIDQSFIVSGPAVNSVYSTSRSSSDDASLQGRIKVRYESSWPTSLSQSGLVQLVEEKIGIKGDVPHTPKKGRPGMMGRRGTSATDTGETDAGVKSSSEGSKSKVPRSSIISATQQQLLKTHMDGITDLFVLRKPYGGVVSVDRGGGIYVFY